MKAIIDFLSSIKLAIVLLIIITLASVLGTLIPQGRTAAEYAARYGQMSDVLIRLEVTTLYQSWWYMGFLFLFSLNILVCTLTRFSPKLKKTFNPSMEFESKSLSTLKFSSSFQSKKGIQDFQEDLTKELRTHGYKIKEAKKENRSFLLARKKYFGNFGADVVHLGLLVILAGGILSGMTGYRDDLTLSEGEIQSVPRAEFSLRLDKFEILYYEDGRIKDWKSSLTVLDGGEETLQKTIEVNHPLSYKGFVFYQSRYGWDWENPSVTVQMKNTTDESVRESVTLHIGEKSTYQNQGLEIQALQFIPDFILAEDNQVATRSMDPNNPALLIKVLREGEEIFTGWLFANFPDFARMHSQTETDLTFQFVNFEAGHFSGIQLANDPGVNWIWAGCAFLMLGLFLAFYWMPREIRAILESRQGQIEIVLGGVAAKGRDTFKTEFENIVENLRRSK
ncbi:cytochrome c biogenesis protein ResB [Acidobacteriota bacterium]